VGIHKGREFLDYLKELLILKDCAPWNLLYIPEAICEEYALLF